MSLPKTQFLFCLTSFALTLGACSSSTVTPEATTTSNPITSLSDSVGNLTGVERLGWLEFFEDSEFEEIDEFATFVELSEQGQLSNPIFDLLETEGDTCTVESIPFNAPTPTDELVNNFSSLSAGEVLLLTSPAGTYGELAELEIQNGTGYFGLGSLPFPAPSVLTASVPGAEFPAASVTVEAPPAIENFSLSIDELVEEGSTIQWTASGINDTLLSLSFFVQSTPDVFIECMLIDDGEFTLPASVNLEADALATTDAQLVFNGAARVRVGASRQGSDLFIFIRSVSS